MKRKLMRQLLLAGTVSAAVAAAWAAPQGVSISADELSFDGQTNIATASGHIEINDASKNLTGSSGWYNIQTSEAYLEGNVHMTGDNFVMTAGALHAYNNEDVHATGDVYLEKDGRTLRGSEVSYNLSSDYGTAGGGAVLTANNMSLRADYVEGWFKEIKASGSGHVELYSSEHDLVAYGNRIEYTQTPGQNDGKAYLAGNARAVQRGNTLEGEAFDIWLEDGSIQTQGRSTLVIRPQ